MRKGKNMKKLTALMFVCLLALALFACGEGKVDAKFELDDDGNGDMTFKPSEDDAYGETNAGAFESRPDESTDTSASETETDAPETETSAPETTETEDETTSPESLPDEGASVFGSYTGNEYINEFFGFGCHLEGADYVATYEELAEMSGSADATLDELLAGNGVAYALYASGNEGMTTINVTIEDLLVSAGKTLTEGEYLAVAKPQLVPALESVGMTDIVVEELTVVFGDGVHSALSISGDLYGTPFYEAIAVVANGQYMACVTVGCAGEDAAVDALTSGFYAP